MMRCWLLPLSILALVTVRVAAQTPDLSPHGDLDVRCEVCHDASSWVVPSPTPAFDHATTGFVLTGRHAQAACSGCHEDLQFRRVASACADCHLDVHRRRFGSRCDDCHDTSGWDVRDASRASHPATGFPLLGAHAVADCDACHQGSPGEEHTTIPADCLSCHDADYEATRDPDHAANGFSTDCVSCHGMTASGWGSGSFIHSPAFPLTGAHATATCASCHATGYAGTPTDCYACHRPDYEGTDDPGHVAAGFSTDCRQCHSDVSWDGADFDHATSGFALTGAHTSVSCVSCHATGYTGTPTDCYACHRPDYEGTDDPNHVTAGFSTDCRQCHSDASWEGADFDHATSGFALTGAHTSVSCVSCHATGYTGTPTNCYACHRPDFEGTDDPNHVTAGYSHDCRECHSDASWDDADFNHATSGFPLTGAHTAVTCVSCHTDRYTGTPSECYACHRPVYEATTDPGHVAAAFSTDCRQCHSDASWEGADFDHATSGFALTGAHTTATCVSCHATGYTGTPTDCYACHRPDFEGTNDPDHVAAGFSTDCRQCHSDVSWDGADFDHATSGFALTGAHTTTTCVSCHATGYTGTPTDCYACHRPDYESTNDPDHVAAGYSTDCRACHNDVTWDDADFDHATSGFPLTGAHTTTTCVSCHAAGYAGTPTDCYACHQPDFEGTDDPGHVAAGFSTDCRACHNDVSWDDADFDHATSGFPLTGAHTTTTCVSCHATGYTGTPTDCYACHRPDYEAATEPGHVAAGFNTQCASCHTTSVWQPANWNHDTLFPIYSGRHRDEWNACVDCHVTPTNYAVFECIFCHEHNRTDTDRDHQGEDGYVYQSAACFQCHPRGDE